MQKYNMCDTQNVPKSLVHEYLQATGAVSRAAADVDSVLSSVIITRWDQLELGGLFGIRGGSSQANSW